MALLTVLWSRIHLSPSLIRLIKLNFNVIELQNKLMCTYWRKHFGFICKDLFGHLKGRHIKMAHLSDMSWQPCQKIAQLLQLLMISPLICVSSAFCILQMSMDWQYKAAPIWMTSVYIYLLHLRVQMKRSDPSPSSQYQYNSFLVHRNPWCPVLDITWDISWQILVSHYVLHFLQPVWRHILCTFSQVKSVLSCILFHVFS